jgi:hypothetical protein
MQYWKRETKYQKLKMKEEMNRVIIFETRQNKRE